jgi:hypothetical protein
MAGKKCSECGAHAMIRKDGCDYCTQCGHLGTESREPSAPSAVAGAVVQPVRAVLYREAGDSAKARQPINVYLDGHYQASLIGNVYTEVMLCPGKTGVSVAFNDVTQRYVTKLISTPYVLGKDPTQYFRIAENSAGAAVIEQVSAELARGAVGSLRLQQAHTLSRVVHGSARSSELTRSQPVQIQIRS